jgi:hypothetical protein
MPRRNDRRAVSLPPRFPSRPFSNGAFWPANLALSQAAEGSIYANIYPFFDANTSIDNAISQFHTDYDALRAALNSSASAACPSPSVKPAGRRRR